jgi:hypothetical protein
MALHAALCARAARGCCLRMRAAVALPASHLNLKCAHHSKAAHCSGMHTSTASSRHVSSFSRSCLAQPRAGRLTPLRTAHTAGRAMRLPRAVPAPGPASPLSALRQGRRGAQHSISWLLHLRETKWCVVLLCFLGEGGSPSGTVAAADAQLRPVCAPCATPSEHLSSLDTDRAVCSPPC